MLEYLLTFIVYGVLTIGLGALLFGFLAFILEVFLSILGSIGSLLCLAIFGGVVWAASEAI